MIRSKLFTSLFLGSFLVCSATTAHAVFIDFDTRQDGTAYVGLGDFFPANEYNGVVINDSDPAAGSTGVNSVNPVNVGTAISGYHVNIGAFDGTATQLTLDFTTLVDAISFDFAAPQGFLTVTAFDGGGGVIFNNNFLGTDNFLSQTGAPFLAGHVDINGIGNISSLLLEPNPNETLMLDNLRFNPVPVPAAVWLFGSGLLGLIGFAKRRTC